MLTTILAFIIVLGVLVLVHELGHFVSAKLFRVKVLEFAIGFPPRILSFKKKETKYSIGAIPLGGYVSMLGENEKSDDKRAFNNQTPSKRLVIAVSGVLMNFILAWLLLVIGFSVGMTPIAGTPRDMPSQFVSTEVTIMKVIADSPADQAGLKDLDQIISLRAGDASLEVTSSKEVGDFIRQHSSEELTLKYRRDGKDYDKAIKLDGGDEAPLGISMADYSVVKTPVGKSFSLAFKETVKIASMTFLVIKNLFSTLFSRGEIIEGVGGPVAIFTFSGMALKAGIVVFLQFIAMLSINLGLINLLPIPALDGGRILFILIEKILGRKVVKDEIEGIIHTIGFIFLMILIVAITYRDIIRLFGG